MILRRRQGGACWVTRRLRASHTSRAHREARNLEAEAPQALGAEVGSGRTSGALGRLAEVLLVRGKAPTRVIPTAPLRWWSWIMMVVVRLSRWSSNWHGGRCSRETPGCWRRAHRRQAHRSQRRRGSSSRRVGRLLPSTRCVWARCSTDGKRLSTALRSRRLITYLSCPI